MLVCITLFHGSKNHFSVCTWWHAYLTIVLPYRMMSLQAGALMVTVVIICCSHCQGTPSSQYPGAPGLSLPSLLYQHDGKVLLAAQPRQKYWTALSPVRNMIPVQHPSRGKVVFNLISSYFSHSLQSCLDFFKQLIEGNAN